MNRLKTILVGVDFSDGSRRALEQAVRLAQWNQAHLRIIHALDPDVMDFVGEEMPPALDELRLCAAQFDGESAARRDSVFRLGGASAITALNAGSTKHIGKT